MSCFGGVATTGAYSSSGMRGGSSSRRPWRWWRSKCVGIAASVSARLRRSIKGLEGRRPHRRTPLSSSSSSMQRGWYGHHHQHHRSFAPVYVDELYNHHQPAKTLHVVREEPSTSAGKMNAPVNTAAGATTRAASGRKATARVAAATSTTTSSSVGAGAGSGKAARAGGVGAMRSVLMMSPGRGGGVLGVAKGMGEVDLRAELFIRKFKEDMRLQSQRSAEEFHAMLARGL